MVERENFTIGERLKSGTARILLGTAFRVINLVLETFVEIPFSYKSLDRMLEGDKNARILRFSRYVTLTGDRLKGVYIHIDFSGNFAKNHFSVREALGDVLELIVDLKNYQSQHKAPIQIIVDSFWLKRKQIKNIFLGFLENQYLPYRSLDDGGIGLYDHLIYFSMLPLRKFRSIQNTGIEIGLIFIPGGKDEVLDSFVDRDLHPEEMARIYNEHYGLKQPF